jgi:hypothetical protein
MRWKKLTLKILALLSFGFVAAVPASATDWHGVPGYHGPAGYGHERVIKHHVYYPRYHHVYRVHGGTDPYAYAPEHRHYYPYYNSGYWRPAHEMRHRPRPHYVLPKYYPAWGYPKHVHQHHTHQPKPHAPLHSWLK